jgi:SAM-dependent methyltransferase
MAIDEAKLRAEPRIADAFRTGEDIGWHEHKPDIFFGSERFFRPGYAANLAGSWIPALDRVQAKLEAGAHVADVDCGHGASTVLMAEEWPHSTFAGFDGHIDSVEQARKRAADAGVADRCHFEVASAKNYPLEGFDLVATFDSLHDMGDPVAAATHVLSSLESGGTWMIVEPAAGDRIEDNLIPVGRAYYDFSTLLCVPNSPSQEVGLALGAQGEAAIRRVVTQAGFSRFRRAAETPFNLVFEARP